MRADAAEAVRPAEDVIESLRSLAKKGFLPNFAVGLRALKYTCPPVRYAKASFAPRSGKARPAD